MKKLFIQFYLLLFVCFLVMSLLVGLVYKLIRHEINEGGSVR
ncbi:TPA: histidine kinase [Escherichia coli]|nr:N-terminal part of sensor histidine protein kinase RstB [Escherichia coli ABU 83972]EEJ47428.1 putative sensor protein RstB [Escherichia coli 83972]HBA1327931.1 histidine kinase [Escherichia coli]